MIQIDDAGSGSILGGTCIGINRVKPYEYYYEIIPLKLYSEKDFQSKSYLDYVTMIVMRGFDKLSVSKEEEIYVCRGYMFDKLRKWFKSENYNYTNTKIEEPLQSIVEKTFEDYTISLGLPSKFIKYTKYPFHLHSILKWVYADYDNRKVLCKTGWKSWKKYKNLKTNISYGVVSKSNYICLKCGSPIKNNSKVQMISYISNRKYTIYLHQRCNKSL